MKKPSKTLMATVVVFVVVATLLLFIYKDFLIPLTIFAVLFYALYFSPVKYDTHRG